MPSDAERAGKPEISVLICTFHRQGLLYGLLESLQVQTNPPEFETIIIDNDPYGSAAMVARNPKWEDLHVSYEIERRVGISFARNHAVELAAGDYLVMIDDDEKPTVDWLSNLFRSITKFDADAVFGPVLPYYSPGAPVWVRRGGFLTRERLITGAEVPDNKLCTGNLIMRRSLLEIGIRFDPTLSLSGGEDVLFFRMLRSRGARFRWCDEAVVYEFQPETRYALAWHLRRSFRGAQNYAHQQMSAEIHGRARLFTAMSTLLKAMAFLFLAASMTLVTAVLAVSRGHRHIPIGNLCRTAAQLGKLSILFPIQVREYGTNPPPLTEEGRRIADAVEEESPFRDRRRNPRWPHDLSLERRAIFAPRQPGPTAEGMEKQDEDGNTGPQ